MQTIHLSKQQLLNQEIFRRWWHHRNEEREKHDICFYPNISLVNCTINVQRKESSSWSMYVYMSSFSSEIVLMGRKKGKDMGCWTDAFCSDDNSSSSSLEVDESCLRLADDLCAGECRKKTCRTITYTFYCFFIVLRDNDKW